MQITTDDQGESQHIEIRLNHCQQLWNNLFGLGPRLVVVHEPLSDGAAELEHRQRAAHLGDLVLAEFYPIPKHPLIHRLPLPPTPHLLCIYLGLSYSLRILSLHSILAAAEI